jgi:5-methyltetrahydropteroyltriglutamate--homocysteine methyltransferase
MKRSTERILTTHTGSLPRPDHLLTMLKAKETGELYDHATFAESVRNAVTEVVRRQREIGLDVVNDGEMGKISYATYVKDRLTGFEGEGSFPLTSDIRDYPGYDPFSIAQRPKIKTPACTGPIEYKDMKGAETDITNFRVALSGVKPEDTFLSAASPGVIALFLENHHYQNDEAYLYALADAMKVEYDAIHQAGSLLQVDCPDLAAGQHIRFADAGLEAFRRRAGLQVEALNHALAAIPPERMRMHLCWGNYEGPHHRDVPLKDIIDIVLKARPAAISFEAANPRHAHEWRVFQQVKVPEGRVLIPGVLDTTTNFIEHPELVAERIIRFANLVGREKVMAGADCGFSTFAGSTRVFPGIVWAKLQAMVEGARLASQQLW